MNRGIVGVHARNHQHDKLQNRQNQVDDVEDFRRIAHFGDNFAQRRTGAFRLDQMRRTLTELRYERQCQHQHAHTANPVREGTPEHDSLRQVVEVLQHGRARCREAGHGLEQRVDVVRNHAAEHERQRTKAAQRNPRQRHGQEALPRAQIPLARPHQKPQGRTNRNQNQHRRTQRPCVAILLEQCNHKRWSHAGGFNQQHCPLHISYKPFIHLLITSFKSPMPFSQTMITTWSPSSILSSPKGTMTFPCRAITATSAFLRICRFFSGMPM